MTQLLLKVPREERRTPDQLRQHYEIEKELAERLRQSRKEDRADLYSTVYDELFKRVPAHPQLTRVADAGAVQEIVDQKMALLRPFINQNTVFLELGAGDCRLSMEVAKSARQVWALDVSVEVTKGIIPPPNFELVISNGTDIPIPDATVDVAYSYQLMEHIHPDDALEQLRNVYRVLRPEGLYICVTPNRVTGPHDISKYFDNIASGFHLREYTIGELGALFTAIGYGKAWAQVGMHGYFFGMPCAAVARLEAALLTLPRGARRRLSNSPGLRNILLAAVIAQKS